MPYGSDNAGIVNIDDGVANAQNSTNVVDGRSISRYQERVSVDGTFKELSDKVFSIGVRILGEFKYRRACQRNSSIGRRCINFI